VPREAAEALSVLQHVQFVDSSDIAHVVGEVYNGTDKNIQWVTIKGSFYDKDKKLLAEEETYAYIDILRPDEKTPFDLMLWEAPAGLDSYDLEVSGDETIEEPFLGIQFVQHDASTDDDNNLTLVGEVTNVGEQPASQIQVACALYDAEGRVVDVGVTYIEGDILDPEGISPFKLYVSDVNGDPESYHIVAYGQEASEYDRENQADLEMLTINHYIDEWDDLVIVGEVKNADIVNATFVKVYASFYDQDDKLVAVDWNYAWHDILEPEDRSPFEIELFDPPESVDHWTVWVQGSRTDDSPKGDLTLENTDNIVDEENLVTFTGNVKNNGKETMTYIEVGVTIYDADKSVIAMDWIYLDGDLAPNVPMPFEFKVQTTEAADSFQLYVQGQVKE